MDDDIASSALKYSTYIAHRICTKFLIYLIFTPRIGLYFSNDSCTILFDRRIPDSFHDFWLDTESLEFTFQFSYVSYVAGEIDILSNTFSIPH